MERISQGRGDQELRPFSSSSDYTQSWQKTLRKTEKNNTGSSGPNNEMGQRKASPQKLEARKPDRVVESLPLTDGHHSRAAFPREADKMRKRVSDNTPTVSTDLRELRRRHTMITDQTRKSVSASSNEVELAGQGVGSQKQRDVSPSSQGAREEDRGGEGPSGLDSKRQVGFGVAKNAIESNNGYIHKEIYNSQKKTLIENMGKNEHLIEDLDERIPYGGKFEFSYSKEFGGKFKLDMSWEDKIPRITENKRDIGENNQYDVFVSYNSDDEDIAVEIAKKLKGYNIKPWLRKWEIDVSEMNLVHATDMGIKNSKSMAVIFGMHDIEKRQQKEIAAFFPRAVYKGCPIIPVYLSKDSRSKSSPLLFSRVGINFYSETDRKFDSKKFDKSVLKIIWGINGKNYKNKINNENETFDTFISYKTGDKKDVKKIANQLKQHQILPWLDDWELRPGTLAFTEMEQSFKKSKSMVVVLGNHGTGRWQDREIETFLHFFGRKKSQIVLLLSKDSESKISNEIKNMLKNCVKVDFSGDDSDKALSELIEHIPGGVCQTRNGSIWQG